MKLYALIATALICGSFQNYAAQAAAAPAKPQAATTPAPKTFALDQYLKNHFHLFDAKRDYPNSVVKAVNLDLRMQYGVYAVAPAGGQDRILGDKYNHGRDYNQEWRRFRFGGDVAFNNGLSFKNIWNIGGMETLSSFDNQTRQWKANQLAYSLYELYFEYATKQVTYGLGKMKPKITGEYRTSSSEILTIERSNLVNQLRSETNYGFQAGSANKKAKVGWAAGLWVNSNRSSARRIAPVINSTEGVFTTATVSYDTSNHVFLKDSRLWLDYAHNFTTLRDKASYTAYGRAASNFQGTGALDVLALSWEGKQGNFALMSELMAGFNVLNGDEGAENVAGITLMPSYKFGEHWEGVFRYQLVSGSNAVKWDKRFTSNTTYSSSSDLLQAFYTGVNYYIFGQNRNMAKIMCGVEYARSSGRNASDQKAYTGWTFSLGLRTNF